MTTSPRTPKSRNLPVVVGLIGVFVVVVLGTIICVLFLRLRSVENNARPQVAAATRPPLNLPTVSEPAATPVPPAPGKIVYIASEPIQGYSSCTTFGFKGVVTESNGTGLQNVQVVVWEEQAGLLALTGTDNEGNYLIEILEKPATRKLWVQIFENDVPVSQPVLVETQPDCQNGFQIYKIDWQKTVNN